MAETELLAPFRREEPRSAVETLCRSLAGKNRQLARQIDEYGKLVRRVKQLERGVERGRRGWGARRGFDGRRFDPTGSAKEPPSPERFGKERTMGDGKERTAQPAAGWTVPSDARGAPTTTIYGTTSRRRTRTTRCDCAVR